MWRHIFRTKQVQLPCTSATWYPMTWMTKKFHRQIFCCQEGLLAKYTAASYNSKPVCPQGGERDLLHLQQNVVGWLGSFSCRMFPLYHHTVHIDERNQHIYLTTVYFRLKGICVYEVSITWSQSLKLQCMSELASAVSWLIDTSAYSHQITHNIQSHSHKCTGWVFIA